MPFSEVYNRVAEKYSSMTKKEKKIADHFLKEKNGLELITITELAEACGVADSTIFRFCKILGYNGYNDFKLAVAKAQGKAQHDQNQPDCNQEIDINISQNDTIATTSHKLVTTYEVALKQTEDLLDHECVAQAARILRDSNRVYCFGQGGSLITAMEAWSRFLTVSTSFTTVQETHLQVITASLLTDRDTIWFFSYSGSTKDMVDILAPAHKRGTKIIVVTRFKKSPATQYADVVLICGSNESPLQSGTIVAKIAQLFVIDMVYQEYIRLCQETCDANRDVSAKAISNRLL